MFKKMMNDFRLQHLTEKTVAVTQSVVSNAGAIAFDDFVAERAKFAAVSCVLFGE